FLDDANANFLRGREGESIRSFDAAVKIHKTLTGGGVDIDASKLFTNATLRSEFGITAQDEQTSQGEINGNPARSKECPNTNVQAMMAYELMTQGLSIAFWIESRDLRRFDTHISRGDGGYSILSRKGQPDQLDMMRKNLWTPLKTFVAKLKATPYGTSGKSYYDYTTIVLASEMGRTINGDVEAILQSADSDAVKYQKIMEQDCCQHWKVSSAAFLGGTVRGNSQWGRVGGSTLEPIPILANGALDPAYDADTGQLKGTKSAQSFVTDAGHVYSTALHLSGLDPSALRGQGKGRNDRPPLAFIKK
ncbi:MAG TPA: hypothetical protein VEY30_07715, partial [Myxococcaceae bacterium]|nr:hypothetical protein [Myxococcaceae bacterium]